MIDHRFEIPMLLRSINSMLHAVGIESLDEVPFLRHECRQSLAGQVAALSVQLDLVGMTRQFLQLDEPVEGGNGGHGQSGQVSPGKGAVGLPPARVAGGQQIPGRAGQEEVVLGIAACLEEVGTAFEQRQVMFDGLEIAADQ